MYPAKQKRPYELLYKSGMVAIMPITRIAQSEHNVSPFAEGVSRGWQIRMEHVTSNEFDAILNILEGLYSSINTIADPK